MQLNKDQLMSLLRTVLSMVCGILVGKGIINAEQAATITNGLLVAAPALVAVGVAIWGAVSKTDKAKVIAAANLPGTTVIVDPKEAPPAAVATANDPSQPNVHTKE